MARYLRIAFALSLVACGLQKPMAERTDVLYVTGGTVSQTETGLVVVWVSSSDDD